MKATEKLTLLAKLNAKYADQVRKEYISLTMPEAQAAIAAFRTENNQITTIVEVIAIVAKKMAIEELADMGIVIRGA